MERMGLTKEDVQNIIAELERELGLGEEDSE
jgi:hypothetical protein